MTAEKALCFEPASAATRKFLEVVLPRLKNSSPAMAARVGESPSKYVNASHADYMARYYQKDESAAHTPPFELEVVEAALTVATGGCAEECAAMSQRNASVRAPMQRQREASDPGRLAWPQP